jgi:hypothetical protein
VPFNARLYEIKEAFIRYNKGPLIAYLRSGTIDVDVQAWLADTIDPAIAGGHKLEIKGPPHRPAGGKALDNGIAIGEAMHALMNDPADRRPERDKVKEVAAKFRCSDSKVRKNYRNCKKAWEV